MELLGASNPWAKGLRCDRNNCLPCQGKELLIMEEALRPVPEPGQPNPPKPGREETKSLPNCTTEGVGYYIECWQCRLNGKMFCYVGESSRSAHQRGKEHMREIAKGKKLIPW